MVTAVSQIVALPNRVPKSEFVAGRLCLAFCNTVALPDAADRLADPAGLSAWALRAGYPLDSTPGPDDFAACITLRRQLQMIFEALADGKSPPQQALDWLAGICVPPRLVWDAESGRARPQPADGRFDQLRQALIADAVDLLSGTAQARIKRCPAHDCRWLFFDTSRNGTRRWCAMADCGVKDKVQRFRRKQPAF